MGKVIDFKHFKVPEKIPTDIRPEVIEFSEKLIGYAINEWWESKGQEEKPTLNKQELDQIAKSIWISFACLHGLLPDSAIEYLNEHREKIQINYEYPVKIG